TLTSSVPPPPPLSTLSLHDALPIFVNAALPEALGKHYVARHFPPGAKARMDALVANLIEAYRQQIAVLPWMGDETKARALLPVRSEEHTSELQSRFDLVCRLLLEKK